MLFFAYGRNSVIRPPPEIPLSQVIDHPAFAPTPSSGPDPSPPLSSGSSIGGAQRLQQRLASLLRGAAPRAGARLGSSLGAMAGEALPGAMPWGIGSAILPEEATAEIGQEIGQHLGERVGARVGEITDRVSANAARRLDALMDRVQQHRQTPQPPTTGDPPPSTSTPVAPAPQTGGSVSYYKYSKEHSGTTGGKEGLSLWSSMATDLRITEIFSSWENDEVTTSFARAIFLSSAKLSQRRELTKEEERLFSWEVRIAKLAEIRSFCQNDAFEVCAASTLPVRAQTGRWLLTWKLAMSDDGTETWSVKARLCIRGFEDDQQGELRVRSPTAGRTGQRLVLCTGVLKRWEVLSVDIPTAFLQGSRLDTQSTDAGEDRIAAMRPPPDT
jgi:hypothetical protein